jgi:hypothetical protein
MTKAKTRAIAKTEPSGVPAAAVRAQLHNDWSKVTEDDKLKYAISICKALDIPTPLNPFKFINMKGKTVLYATKEAAELIAERNKISVNVVNKYLDKEQNIYVVEVRALMPHGRTFDNFAALSVSGLTGEARANAMMKTMSKAIRRVVFAAVGLSVMDETDLPTNGGNYAPSPTPVAEAPTATEVNLSNPETIAARGALFQRLTAKGGRFHKNIPAARKWIEENNNGDGIEKCSPDDCQELNAILDREEEEEKAPELPLTKEREPGAEG